MIVLGLDHKRKVWPTRSWPGPD